MKRGIAVLVLVILVCAAVLLFALRGSQEVPNTTPILAQMDPVSPTGGTLTLTNQSGEEYLFGAAYYVEQRVNGQWEPIPIEPAYMTWSTVGYKIFPGESRTFDLDWQDRYGALPAGEYRVRKSGLHSGKEENFYAEFTIAPSPSPTPESIHDPVCILYGEEITSLCGTAFSYDAMITADGKLLAWRETPFDLDQCVLHPNGSFNVYELPLKNVTGAWLGRTSILALDKDGILWGIGSNLHGQLWDAPELEGWNTLVKVTDHVVSASISGWDYSAVLKDDGGVWLTGGSMTQETILPPTRIAEIKGGTEIYAAPYLYVGDRDGVSWRLGYVDKLLKDPTALMSGQYSGGKWLKEDLWLADEGDLVRILPSGEERILLTNVADVDLSYQVYATAVTKNGDLYVWNEEETAQYEGLSFHTPTKVMERVKLAGAWEFGVVVVTETDGSVWAIYKDTLEAAQADGRLLGTLVSYDFRREQMATSATVEGFYHRPFEELPAELLDSLKFERELSPHMVGLVGYSVILREYTAPGISIMTTQAPEDKLRERLEYELALPPDDESRRGTDEELQAEFELEKGREWLYSVTITDDSYETAWGLKVGRSVEEAEALGYQYPWGQALAADGEFSYGDSWDHGMMIYMEDGTVTKLKLTWGLGRFVGKYWDL